MEINYEKALASLNKHLKTILFDKNRQTTTFSCTNCEVLIDLINHPNADYSVMVSDSCGKATAALLTKTSISTVYALKMSDSAIEYLKDNGITYFYNERVRILMNDEENDLDEYEKLTITQDDIYESINDHISAKRIKDYWAAHCANALSYQHIIDISNGCHAISSLYDAYSIKQLREPRKKDLSIAVDCFKMPCGLLETREIIVCPLGNIDEELTMKEGLNLQRWQQEILPRHLKEAQELRLKSDDSLWIMFEIFEKIAD